MKPRTRLKLLGCSVIVFLAASVARSMIHKQVDTAGSLYLAGHIDWEEYLHTLKVWQNPTLMGIIALGHFIGAALCILAMVSPSPERSHGEIL